jgi:hypothetical protein
MLCDFYNIFGNVTLQDGNTCLHLASSFDNLEAVKCLVEHKANIQATNKVYSKQLSFLVVTIDILLDLPFIFFCSVLSISKDPLRCT